MRILSFILEFLFTLSYADVLEVIKTIMQPVHILYLSVLSLTKRIFNWLKASKLMFFNLNPCTTTKTRPCITKLTVKMHESA